MKRIIFVVMLAVSAASAYEVPKWRVVTDTTNARKTIQDQYIFEGRHYFGNGGVLVPVAEVGDVIAGGDSLSAVILDSLDVLAGQVEAAVDTTEAIREDVTNLADSLANQGYPQGASITVAASDSYNKEKADYICDGTGDDVQIHAAIADAVDGIENNVVKLLPGSYYLQSGIVLSSHVSIDGRGARIFSQTDTMNALLTIDVAYTGGGRPIFVSGLELAPFSDMTDSATVLVRSMPYGSSIRGLSIWHNQRPRMIVSASHIMISNLYLERTSFAYPNLVVRGSYNVITNSEVQQSLYPGIDVTGNYNLFSGMKIYSYGAGSKPAIHIRGGDYNTFSALNTYGDKVLFADDGSTYNSLTASTFYAAGDSAIYLASGANYNAIGPNSENSGFALIDGGTGNRYFFPALPDTVLAHSDSIDVHRGRLEDLEDVALTAAQIDTVDAAMDSLTAHRHRLEDLEADTTAEVMVLGDTLTTDLSWVGITETGRAGEDLAFGELCYLKSDGKWWLADADSAETMPGMAVALGTIAADAAGTFLSSGRVRNDAWNLSIGGIIFPSTTKRTYTQAAPDGAGDQIQAIGVAATTNEIKFTPYPILVEHQ